MGWERGKCSDISSIRELQGRARKRDEDIKGKFSLEGGKPSRQRGYSLSGTLQHYSRPKIWLKRLMDTST